MYNTDMDNEGPKLHSVGDSVKLPFTRECGMCTFVCVRLVMSDSLACCIQTLVTPIINKFPDISGHISVEKCDCWLRLPSDCHSERELFMGRYCITSQINLRLLLAKLNLLTCPLDVLCVVLVFVRKQLNFS